MSTAAIIADACGVTHTVDAAFNDRDYGPWTGHLKDDVIAQFGSVSAAPGVEPVEAVMAKVLPALEALASADESVVVVTHDAVIGPILTHVQPGIDVTVENGAWAVLVLDGDRWITIGMAGYATLYVAHTLAESDLDSGRIISARAATRHERRKYEEGE